MKWIDEIIYGVLAAFASLGILAVAAGFVRAQPVPQQPDVSSVQCPAPTPQSPAATCKVIVLSPLEEQALAGDRGILDTAQLGRPLDLTGAVTYFRDKIKNAPEGKPATPQMSSPVDAQGKLPDGSPVMVPVPPKPDVGAVPRRAPNAPAPGTPGAAPHVAPADAK